MRKRIISVCAFCVILASFVVNPRMNGFSFVGAHLDSLRTGPPPIEPGTNQNENPEPRPEQIQESDSLLVYPETVDPSDLPIPVEDKEVREVPQHQPPGEQLDKMKLNELPPVNDSNVIRVIPSDK